MENLTLTLTEDLEYTYQSYETASWYDTYTLRAGTYPVVLANRFNRDYAVVRVSAVLTREHRVNRVFSASSNVDRTPNTETTVPFSFDLKEAVAGKKVHVGSTVLLLEVADDSPHA